jgi:hypothetical protein
MRLLVSSRSWSLFRALRTAMSRSWPHIGFVFGLFGRCVKAVDAFPGQFGHAHLSGLASPDVDESLRYVRRKGICHRFKDVIQHRHGFAVLHHQTLAQSCRHCDDFYEKWPAKYAGHSVNCFLSRLIQPRAFPGPQPVPVPDSARVLPPGGVRPRASDRPGDGWCSQCRQE